MLQSHQEVHRCMIIYHASTEILMIVVGREPSARRSAYGMKFINPHQTTLKKNVPV